MFILYLSLCSSFFNDTEEKLLLVFYSVCRVEEHITASIFLYRLDKAGNILAYYVYLKIASVNFVSYFTGICKSIFFL